MGTAIATWFLQAVLGELGNILLGMFRDFLGTQAAKAQGRAEAAADQARAGAQVEADLAQEATHHTTVEDAITQLDQGGA